MSKILKSSNVIRSINEIISIAKSRKIVHLFTEDEYFNGRDISISGRKMINFGSCSYLGLEIDKRLKEASIDAIMRYGTQFSSSRTYVSFTLYEELESLLAKIFSTPVILSSSTSLGHQAVIPILIEDKDAVIMDHQAHISMQDTLQKLQVRGIAVTLLRHSRLDELEKKLVELSPRYEKVWYFLDSVYSMYGDVSPIEKLIAMLQTYPKLHLYIDDAHGMSWQGRNGSGYILSKTTLHPRMVLSTSLAKGFGSAGGVFIIPDKEFYARVKHWGGPLTYSGPQQPAVIGASIASAQIHLSSEIYERQKALHAKVTFCNQLLEHYRLPVIKPSESPIFYIGLGLTKVGYNMVQRLMRDGLYINLGIFPAVPESCTGIRFTLNLHHREKDIEDLVESLRVNLPKALKEENRTTDDIYRAFRNVHTFPYSLEAEDTLLEAKAFSHSSSLQIQYEQSVIKIGKQVWDRFHGEGSTFDFENLCLLEKSFQGNCNPEDNWSFHYYIIRDANFKVVLATFFTLVLVKNDFLSAARISDKMESKRTTDSYYQTSYCMMMGSLITEGEHLYLDRENPLWKQAFVQLLDSLWVEQEKQQATMLYLRDFSKEDVEVRDFLIDQGFIKLDMPDTHLVADLKVGSTSAYLLQLTAKKRGHIVKDVIKKRALVNVEILKNPSAFQLNELYNLYENVCNNSREVNVFKLPKIFFENLNDSDNWEVICLRLSKNIASEKEDKIIGAVWCCRKSDYYPVIIGLDYKYIKKVNIYKQALYCILDRAIKLGCKNIHYGITASLEKRKLGAKVKEQVAFFQAKNHYELSLLEVEGQNN